MFGVCVAKRIPWPVGFRARMANACCLLLVHLINVQPQRKSPLIEGPVGLFRGLTQEYGFRKEDSPPSSPSSPPVQKVQEQVTQAYMFEMDREQPDEPQINTIGNQPIPLDLITPKKTSGPANDNYFLIW
jgi:hypothetical protein